MNLRHEMNGLVSLTLSVWIRSLGFMTMLILLILFHSCETNNPKKTMGNDSAVSVMPKPPTATEVFHLRSECAEFGVKIQQDNLIGAALTQSQVSHYDIKNNRCYVELTVQSADLSGKYFANYLFDGQTKELIAWVTTENGITKQFCMRKPLYTVEDVTSYINEMMGDH